MKMIKKIMKLAPILYGLGAILVAVGSNFGAMIWLFISAIGFLNALKENKQTEVELFVGVAVLSGFFSIKYLYEKLVEYIPSDIIGLVISVTVIITFIVVVFKMNRRVK